MVRRSFPVDSLKIEKIVPRVDLSATRRELGRCRANLLSGKSQRPRRPGVPHPSTPTLVTSTPHDALFRFTFSKPENAVPLIRSNLPPALARRIDWTSLTALPTSFVEEVLQHRQCDLLFSAKLDDSRDVLLYVLVEHQSSSDAFMPFRMLRYIVRIWDEHLAHHDGAKRLPAVIPILICHGPTAGGEQVASLHDLIDLGAELKHALGEHLASLRVHVDDLRHQDDAALRERAFTHAGELAIRSLAQLAEHPDPLALFTSWLDLMRELLQARSGADALVSVLRYALEVTDLAPEALRATLALQLGPPAEEVFMTAAEKLTEEVRKQALAQGEAKGRAEGEAKGRAQGKAELMLKLLDRQFGPVPERAQAKVRGASADELDRLLDRVLGAKSLDDVID